MYQTFFTACVNDDNCCKLQNTPGCTPFSEKNRELILFPKMSTAPLFLSFPTLYPVKSSVFRRCPV